MSSVSEKIYSLRNDYKHAALDESGVGNDPIALFSSWLEQALHSEITDANAMTLGTCNLHLRPSLRVVLLRKVDDRGFSFFTNYESRKGKEIELNPWASLSFYWAELERQIRIEGSIYKVPATESDEYFMSRPRESRIGAWASPQSHSLADRKALDALVEKYEKQFEGKEVTRPPHWGGYIVAPDYIEFWQGRESRLHDRISFSKRRGNGWEKSRLAP